MGRRVKLSGVLFLTLIMVNLTRFADIHERDEGRCDWVCEVDDLNFGKELSNFKKQGTIIKADVQYKEIRVANPQINNSSNISAEVWMTCTTDNVFQSHGFMRFVNSTLMQIVLSGQLVSWEYRKLAIFSCIKPRSRNLLLNYSTDLKNSACKRPQRPLLDVRARAFSNHGHVRLVSFFGYLWMDKNSRVSIGFVNPRHDQLRAYDWEFYLICIVFTFYCPAILTLFCTTDLDITVPVRPAARAEGPTENQENPEKSSRDGLSGRHKSQDFTSEDDNENFITDQEEDGMIMTVRLMNISGLNPVGFRSVIANYIFSNTVNHSKCRKFVKLVLLVLFPVSIPLLGDLYFLTMPRIFSRIAPSLPSHFLTTSVIHFASEKCPYMLMFLFFYIIRCLCLCFTPTTTIWAPSFVCRKHLKCAIYSNYCVQLIFMCFPRCNIFSLSACDECKRTSNCPKQCEVPENIKHNLEVQGQIFMKHWNYVYGHLSVYWKQLVEEQKWFLLVIGLICLFPVLSILVGVYVLLVLIDILFSSPILSLCYQRMWVTGEWLEHKPQFHFRIIRFLCHALEFLLICGSVAWVTYFSYCASLVVEIAIRGVQNSLVSHSVETFKYLTIVTTFFHSCWSCYKSLTGKYIDLTLELFKSYKESYKQHGDKLINYQQAGMLTFPKDLFDKAYEKQPLSVEKAMYRLIWLSASWLFFFAVFRQIETTYSGFTNYVVTAVCGFISWAHPLVIDFIGKKKETEDVFLEEIATNAVEDYISDLT